MVELNLIEKSKSAWSSPIVLTDKPENTICFCNDFRKLSLNLMPRVSELIESVANAWFITTLDLTKGCWQIPLSAGLKENTGGTPDLIFSSFKPSIFADIISHCPTCSPSGWLLMTLQCVGNNSPPPIVLPFPCQHTLTSVMLWLSQPVFHICKAFWIYSSFDTSRPLYTAWFLNSNFICFLRNVGSEAVNIKLIV